MSVTEMLWKTRHFARNQKISAKAAKQVQHDVLRVQPNKSTANLGGAVPEGNNGEPTVSARHYER